MLVPSTCKAVTHVLSRVSCGLGVHAPAGTWALHVTGLVVALSVVPPPDGSVVAVALAWFVVGYVATLKVAAGAGRSPGREGFDLSAFQLPHPQVFPLSLSRTFNTMAPPPLV